MGYLKVVCEAPGVQKSIENLLCLAVGARRIPEMTWWDFDEEDRVFTIMGLTANQAEKLIKYLYDKAPEYSKSYLRFRMVGYSADDFRKPRDSWEALAFMLQSFPKRKRLNDNE